MDNYRDNMRRRLTEVLRLARKMRSAIDNGDDPQNTDLLALQLQANAIINIANEGPQR